MPFQTENDTVIANAKSYFQFLLQLASPSAVVAFLSIQYSPLPSLWAKYSQTK
jgi:hypothetical protein